MTDRDLYKYLGPAMRSQMEHVRDAAVSGERPVYLKGLAGAGSGLALYLLSENLQGAVVAVTPDTRRSAELAAEYAFFSGAGKDGPAPKRRPLVFPAFDISPYESVSPMQRVVHRRVECLHRLLTDPQHALVLVPMDALMQRVPPRPFIQGARLDLYKGLEIDRDALVETLTGFGYQPVNLTEDVGDFSVRGSIVDVFPPNQDHPLRLDFAGDVLEDLRSFSPENQLTRERIESASVICCREVCLTAEARARFETGIKGLADSLSVGRSRREVLATEVQHGVYFPGIEFFLPLFYERTGTLTDYLPGDSLVFLDRWVDAQEAALAFEQRVHRRRETGAENKKLVVPVPDLYLSAEEVAERTGRLRRVFLGSIDVTAGGEFAEFDMGMESNQDIRRTIVTQEAGARMLAPLAESMDQWSRGERKVLLSSPTPEGIERLLRLLGDYGLAVEADPSADFPAVLEGDILRTRTASVLRGDLRKGFRWKDAGLWLISEEDIFGEKRHRVERPRVRASQVISSFGDLKQDDFIVHVRHGIGIYRGLVRLEIGGAPNEYLHLEYARGDKLYMPVDRLGMIQRYVGSEGSAPRIDRLGGTAWDKARRKAKASVKVMARELLDLYAARKALKGYEYSPDDELFREFEATFPYEETPDQQQTIREVLADMQRPEPADRLICGDVGFGKTEVAIRAAFLAVIDGKQAAVLVPTTTLAFQHFRTFSARMSDFGVKVAMLSRFVTDAQRRKVIQGLEAGAVDVVIGTHQLLGKRVRFQDLGLLVIDEEQHFGVAQKEKINSLKRTLDVITLTATPIPRTFNMSLTGIRDLSIINTPPEDRLAIRTFVTRFDEDTIREALVREFARGGQAFFLHNRVSTIDSMAERLRRLVPGVRLAVGHGQMDERRLEKVMIDFSEQKYNLLVCTAIIESGLDFPLANTIIINRADAFGLAQLYQLRGRVGRSDRRAYCYLLIPGDKAITRDAKKRLEVLRNFTELGSGFKIAARDLEIRGTGNLLGPQQSGHIHAVGFEMYHRLLEEAIAELKGERSEEVFEPEITLPIPAFIPPEYIPDEHLRLHFYKRVAGVGSVSGIEALASEMFDRFGSRPPQLENLLRVVDLKIVLRRLRIATADFSATGAVLKFDDDTPVSAQRLVDLVRSDPARYRLSPDSKLIVTMEKDEVSDPIGQMKNFLRKLG